jgi:hypothetical protein
MGVHKLYMAVNVWVTRWMHNIAPPTRPSHVAKRDSAGATKRGGLHKIVAADIDNKLWSGEFDKDAFLQHAEQLEYESPVNFARNEFAKSYNELKTDDEKEASLYTYRAFQYVVWNRKITTLYELRQKCFEQLHAREYAVAASGSDADDDVLE